MAAILNYLNAHNLPIFQLILMTLIPKFMVHRALSDKTYLSLGFLSPLIQPIRNIELIGCFIKMVVGVSHFIKSQINDIKYTAV